MGVKRLRENILRGKSGRNIGISTGSAKIDSIIYGVQRKYLYTIGADTSGGKTSYAIDTFVYNLLKNAGDIPISINYYSFEMSSDILYAKILSRYIWDAFSEVVTYEDILSLTKPLSESHENLINLSMSWLDSISNKLIIYDKALTPNGIYATCKEWLRQFGEFVEVGEHKEEYIDNYPDMYRVVLIDHVGLISGTGSKKEKIDLVADYMIYFRNKCGITGVFVQQLNRNAKSMDRKTNGYELIQLDDFKDTSGTTDASDVVIGLFYPYREKIAVCEKYPIQNILKKRFRLIQIIKNRYGVPDINVGMTFHGEVSMFKELPRPEEISDYDKYINLDYRQEKQEDYEEKDEMNNEYEFKL